MTSIQRVTLILYGGEASGNVVRFFFSKDTQLAVKIENGFNSEPPNIIILKRVGIEAQYKISSGMTYFDNFDNALEYIQSVKRLLENG